MTRLSQARSSSSYKSWTRPSRIESDPERFGAEHAGAGGRGAIGQPAVGGHDDDVRPDRDRRAAAGRSRRRRRCAWAWAHVPPRSPSSGSAGREARSNTTVTSSPSAAAHRSSMSTRRSIAPSRSSPPGVRPPPSPDHVHAVDDPAHGLRLAFVGRPAPGALALRLPALGLEPSAARRLARPRGATLAGDGQSALEATAQALERELAVAGLAAGVLRDRDHPRAGAGDDPPLLLVGERGRRPRRRRRPRFAKPSRSRAGRRVPTSAMRESSPR